MREASISAQPDTNQQGLARPEVATAPVRTGQAKRVTDILVNGGPAASGDRKQVAPTKPVIDAFPVAPSVVAARDAEATGTDDRQPSLPVDSSFVDQPTLGADTVTHAPRAVEPTVDSPYRDTASTATPDVRRTSPTTAQVEPTERGEESVATVDVPEPQEASWLRRTTKPENQQVAPRGTGRPARDSGDRPRPAASGGGSDGPRPPRPPRGRSAEVPDDDGENQAAAQRAYLDQIAREAEFPDNKSQADSRESRARDSVYGKEGPPRYSYAEKDLFDQNRETTQYHAREDAQIARDRRDAERGEVRGVLTPDQAEAQRLAVIDRINSERGVVAVGATDNQPMIDQWKISRRDGVAPTLGVTFTGETVVGAVMLQLNRYDREVAFTYICPEGVQPRHYEGDIADAIIGLRHEAHKLSTGVNRALIGNIRRAEAYRRAANTLDIVNKTILLIP